MNARGRGRRPHHCPRVLQKTNSSAPTSCGWKGWWPAINLLDTGFIAEISPLPGLTGDRVNITVLRARFEVTTKPAGVDVLLPANEKFGAGCSLQIGNAQADGGWAGLVMRTMPAAWGGQLVVGATDGQGPNPKLQLFRNNVALAPAIENQFVYPANGPGNPAPILVQGLRPSAVQGDAVVTLRASDAEGWADAVRMTLQEFFVKEIMFEGVVPISYARIPTAGSYLLAPAAEPAGTHVGPAPRPAVGGAHWKQANSNHEAAQYSWPAVFARQVGAQATNAVCAIFGLFPPMAGNVSVSVRAQGPGVSVLAQQVTFANGQSVPFRFQVTVPATVGCLNGMELTWLFGAAARRTRHTLFITDAMPRTGHFGQAVPYFWEIFEWSCTWAQGMFGENNVRDAIWAQFHPVRQVHGTQLVYWKPTVQGTMLAQDLVTAIRSQDLPEPRRNAASCIVFDRILINCLSAHGMLAAEIKLTAQSTGVRGGIQYNWESWNGTSIIGQGNAMAPRCWRSHWIAVVGTAPNTWVYYDASYGVMVPLALEPVNYLAARRVDSYEPGAVREFNCTEAFFPFRAGTLPRHLTEPPFLLGAWLRNNW